MRAFSNGSAGWQEWRGGQALERRYRVRMKRKYVYVCAGGASLARSCHVSAAHVGGEWAGGLGCIISKVRAGGTGQRTYAR
jgi:hypothetical protein